MLSWTFNLWCKEEERLFLCVWVQGFFKNEEKKREEDSMASVLSPAYFNS